MFYVIIPCFLACFAYCFIKHRYSYWKRLNVPYIEPSFPYGNLRHLGKKIHHGKLLEKFYNELKVSSPQFGGLYFFIEPTLLAINLDFVKNILIKDFNYFMSRGIFYNEKDDPLTGHLFAVDGEKWKGLRHKLSPTFSSGKLRYMFPIVLNVADELEYKLNALIADTDAGIGADLEIKDLMARYTTDVIGTCAFGIECNSLRNEHSEFRKYGKAIFEAPRHSYLKLMCMASFRNVARKLGMKRVAEDVSKFFLSSVRETLEYRHEFNVERDDFLNMMMQLMKHGKLDDDDGTAKGILTFNDVAANCFVFFLAGFETSSTTMMFSLFEFAVNPEIQKKARDEVNAVLEKYNGKFTYDAMMEMHYLDQCVQETLRKYPPISRLVRKCTRDYLVPDTNMVIPKGTTVTVPVYAIHHDADIYPNPQLYDPDRFLPEEVKKRHPQAHIPFGDGPRNCIGLRFGLTQTKIGLATILTNFELSPCSQTKNPLVLSHTINVLAPEGGLWLNIKRIPELND